jgi:heme oxygenase (biliverdin-producing, ferredoxin)
MEKAGAPAAAAAAPAKKSGHGGMPKADPNSFVQGEMRGVAMKLHTRDQAPAEGEKENKGKKFSEWNPSRKGYLQFLVDSQAVYGAFDAAVRSRDELEPLRDTGLERTAALEADIAWMLSEYSSELQAAPAPSARAVKYCNFLAEVRVSLFECMHVFIYAHQSTDAGSIKYRHELIIQKLSSATLQYDT